MNRPSAPSHATEAPDSDDFDFLGLWKIIWRGRALIVSITALFTVAALIYVLVARQWYMAEVLLMPVAMDSSKGGLSSEGGALGGLGGLASLAGIALGGGNTVEPVAVLKSREFTSEFVEEQQLLPVLFEDDWDPVARRWKSSDPDDALDTRDAVRYFDKHVRRVREDKKTGLVTLTVEWTDAETASKWANLLVQRVNQRMRARALQEAEANVTYLKGELQAATMVTLQQSISRLLENELQKLMVARGKEEFAFRVLDHADVPKWRTRPKRAQLTVLAALFGVVVSVFAVFLREAIHRDRQNRSVETL